MLFHQLSLLVSRRSSLEGSKGMNTHPRSIENVKYYRCDVTDTIAIAEAAEQIRAEVSCSALLTLAEG
jgi:hypothetical protein